ncbi:MAG: tetratricopeptide repeat protein [Elusimicrobia bacterium]|nr:tetratricopeptide repeat protein [Elusimicrobiota bacterium]
MDDPSLQGIAHFNAGRFEEALASFQAALASGDRRPETRCFLAHVHDAAARPREAAEEFATALEHFPRYLPAYASLAHLLLRRGAQPGASAALRGVLALKPKRPRDRRGLIETLRACAQAWHAAGELENAEAALRKILRWETGDRESRRKLIEILHAREQSCLSAGRAQPAESALRSALALEPRNKESRRRLVESLRRRAVSHIAAGRLQHAAKAVRAAQAARPPDGRSRRHLKQLERTLAQMRRASRLKLEESLRRDRRRRRSRLAASALTSGFRRYFAASRGPHPSDVEAARARELHNRGCAAAARDCLRRALALRPKRAGARNALLRLSAAARAAAECAAEEERELRRILARSPDNDEARRSVAGLLRARALMHDVPNTPRRYQNARQAWEAVLKIDPRDGLAHLSLSLLMRRIGSPEQERAALSRAVDGELCASDRFKALMRLGRFPEAVCVAEELLDSGLTLTDFRAFSDPWEKDNRPDRLAPQTDLDALDRGLKTVAGPWRDYYLGSLGGPEGLRHFDSLPDEARYRWMHYNAAMEALFSGDFARAVRWFSVALRDETLDWRAHGYFAESYACVDEPEKARREMSRCLDGAPKNERAQVYAWWGELELWLGGYERALTLTSKACELGAPFGHAWKGAALLKLGKKAEALAQLESALRLYPGDEEAILWRAEAKRELGRPREALEELETITPRHMVWVLFNTALCRHALGDERAMRSDFELLPPAVSAHVRRRIGLPDSGELDDRDIVRFLEAGLKLGRGFRRAEYAQAVWLSRRGDLIESPSHAL